MTRVVLSQPFFFPWVGLFEQIRLADHFLHYDDVQFSKGSFTNRVQIKTADGWKWLTVPLADLHLGQLIKDVTVDERQPWRRDHLGMLQQAYRGAPHCREMLEIVEAVYARRDLALGELVIDGVQRCCEYFDLSPATPFRRSSELGIAGKSWQRVLAIVKHLDGDVYVTGHGARIYLDHEAFEAAGVQVEYMDYRKQPYPQLHGAFNPYVSILDLIANAGRDGREVICSGTVSWRAFHVSA